MSTEASELSREGTVQAPERSLADAEARAVLREELDVTLVVEAAAGTGKTSELVGRIAALVASGRTELARVVALTFTDKAAGEMKLRLRLLLEQRRQAEERPRERAYLTLALAQLETAHIATVHAFCADLLRERPIEAAVDPAFQVVEEEDAGRTLQREFARWFEAHLEHPPEGVRRLISQRGKGARGELRSAARNLCERRDFRAPWARPTLDREPSLWRLFRELYQLAAVHHHARRGQDWLVRALAELCQRLERAAPSWAAAATLECQPDAPPPLSEAEVDRVEAALRALERATLPGGHRPLWEYRGGNGELAQGLTFDEARTRLAALREQLRHLNQQLSAELAALLQQELWPVVEAYTSQLAAAGALDFLDLLRSVRDLLAGCPEVRRELGERFSHVFIDEFQDTDPLQAEIVLLLTSADLNETRPERLRPTPGKLFVVGDPKQAIYRFRRADVAVYEQVKRQLLASGARLVQLSTSFRSAPAIQALVNQCFAPLMTGAASHQPDYVPLENFRKDFNQQPKVVALPVPAPYPSFASTPRPTGRALEASYPDAVAAFIDWLIRDSGWQVEDLEGPRPVEPRDVCCLFRRFQAYGQDVTRPYVRALTARSQPHVLVGGRSLHGREEVQALTTALKAIEWPDDALSVYATLRGPLFGFSDSELLELAHHLHPSGAAPEVVARLHPLYPLPRERLPEQTRELADALDLLGELHLGRRYRPIPETISRLLTATRASAGVAIWPSGEQALANLLRVIDHARRYEAGAARSFRGFIELLATQAEQGQGAEALVLEEGSGGVRLMTIHRAKGLEFPIVILCDPGAPLTAQRPSRYVDPARELWCESLAGHAPLELTDHEAEVRDADAAEVVRVAYVAATRARDLLVIPTLGDGPFPHVERWTQVFHPGIYPTDRRAGRPAAGCPSFGEDSVAARPFGEEQVVPVRPGWYDELAGGHGAVWWDPLALKLNQPELGGLRQQEILRADEGDPQVTLAHEAWRATRERRLTQGATVREPQASFTQVARRVREPDDWLVERAAAVAIEGVDTAPDRPRGPRFGTLVHALLERAELTQSPVDGAAPGGWVELLGRQLGATVSERAAAAEACQRALKHPLLQRAARSGALRRECPISWRTPEGELWEGVVDLAFQEPSGWVVVDFKTDLREPCPEHTLIYRCQVALYCEALTAATGERASGYLLGV